MAALGLTCAYGQDAAPVPSSSPNPTPIELEVFEGPKVKKRVFPFYPMSERTRDHEGWVELNFMVDPSGKPYEIVVTDSSGNEAFEREAIKAVAQFEYEPATFEGKPVDASQNLKISFWGANPDARARPKFVRTFERLQAAVQRGEKDVADAELANLQGQNLYELAFTAVAKYEYYVKWGSPAQQLTALEQAIAGEKTPVYLPKHLFNGVLQAMLSLQVTGQDFADAIDTWEIMQNSDIDAAVLARWKPIMEDIAKLRTDSRSFVMQGEIGPGRPSWVTTLLKKTFQIGVVSGKLVEVKLRCDKKYVFFPFDPQIQYRIGNEYGTCRLEIVGDPGTKLKLQQS